MGWGTGGSGWAGHLATADSSFFLPFLASANPRFPVPRCLCHHFVAVHRSPDSASDRHSTPPSHYRCRVLRCPSRDRLGLNTNPPSAGSSFRLARPTNTAARRVQLISPFTADRSPLVSPSSRLSTMADKALAAPASQEPSSGKAPRSWVPRACDRCMWLFFRWTESDADNSSGRKRKARCGTPTRLLVETDIRRSASPLPKLCRGWSYLHSRRTGSEAWSASQVSPAQPETVNRHRDY